MHRGAESLGLSGQRVAGKTEGDFRTRNHKKGEGSQRGQTSEPRQDGFLGTGEGHLLGGAALLTSQEVPGWAPEVLRVLFTVVVVRSDNNDNCTDDKYHLCGSVTLGAPRQHPMR